MRWDRDRTRRKVAAASQQVHDSAAYTRDLEDAARAHNRARHDSPQVHAPQPSKAQLRAEGVKAVAGWEVAHPPPPPWGPWSEWRTITRPDGSTYKERDRTRVRL